MKQITITGKDNGKVIIRKGANDYRWIVGINDYFGKFMEVDRISIESVVHAVKRFREEGYNVDMALVR